MTECSQCKSELELSADSRIARGPLRCAGCGYLFRVGNAEYVSSNRNAWRSLWLGISSIFLAFLTGIPAMYCGVRSFIQMAHSPARSRDQTAAAVGITLGCFGTTIVSIVLIGITFGLIVSIFLTENSIDPDAVLAMQQRICRVDLPDQFKPERSTSTTDQVETAYFSEHRLIDQDGNTVKDLNSSDIESGDESKKFDVDVTARVGLVRFTPQFEFNRISFSIDLKRMQLSEDWDAKPINISKETLPWKMDGIDVEVRKTEATYPNSISTVRYVGFLKSKIVNRFSEDRGMGIIFKTPHETLDEEAVKAIFESFRVPEKPAPKASSN